jgi:hypothetical protein
MVAPNPSVVWPRGIGPLIAVAVGAGIILLRNRQARKLRIELLWIRPVLFAALIALNLFIAPPPITVLVIAALAIACAVGAAIGWQRGKFMRIDVDPATHAMTSQASPWGIVFILGLIGVRMFISQTAVAQHATLGLSTGAVTDILLVFAGAMFVAQSLEMWLRAKRLLAEARAEKPAI